MSRLDDQAEQLRARASAHDEQLASGYVSKDERTVLSIATGEPVDPASVSPSNARTLRFIPIGEFLTTVTAPKWLIRDIVEQDTLALLFGDPEAGKSFLAMDWAASVASGREWNGCPVKQGPVLYVNGEGHNGVNRRFTAWAIANDQPLDDAPLFVSSTTTALTDDVGRAELEAVLAEFQRVHGDPVLIVIDTLARNYGPGDENSTQDMNRAVATCDAIREMTRAVVAIVHHSGHSDKTRGRGGSALRAAVDAEYRMQRVPDSKDTVFDCTKMKEADKPLPIQFRFAAVELGVQDEAGREVTSAVLRRTMYVPPSESGLPKQGRPSGTGKHRKAAVEILRKVHRHHVDNVIASGRDATEARVSVETWRDACLATDMPRQRFSEAMAQLKAGGQIRTENGFVFIVEGTP